MIFQHITQTIGNTPLVQLSKIFSEEVNVFAKIESFNPMTSVKDRLAKALIDDAIKSGKLAKNGVIVEPTSGNTGIGLAFVGRSLGLKVILVMPESASLERRKMMTSLGAELILTPASEGMRGAIAKANQLEKEFGHIMLNQFENMANPKIHKETTGPEIWNALEGEISGVIAGVGTGGTISGVGEFLKSKNSTIQIIAVEPAESPVLSGGTPGPHKIQGIGAGFVPKTFNRSVVDKIVQINYEAASKMCHEILNTEGVFCGISSGAALAATKNIIKDSRYFGKNIVVILPDSGERYLSTGLYG
jgi:cysteine synthase A